MIIDRIEPTVRPSIALAGYQRWRQLLFLHWHVSPKALRQVVPAELELDAFEGHYFVGVVPFAMEGVRAKWWPESLALRFLETNVRTYVLYRGRPGVYFLSLDAQSRLAVAGARLRWGLPYYFAQMRMTAAGRRIEYELKRTSGNAHLRVTYELGDELGPSRPDTLEHFLLERYLLFVRRNGQYYVGHVHHSPYPAQYAHVHELTESLIAASGLPASDGLPVTAHFARGVNVEIYGLQAGLRA